jgi:hypothetical protein
MVTKAHAIQMVARDMAARDGHPPDSLIVVVTGVPMPIVGNTYGFPAKDPILAWEAYAPLAAQILTSIEALGLITFDPE